MQAGTFVKWNGPIEGDLQRGDLMLILMSKSRTMVQVLSGKLKGHIIYVNKSDIEVYDA